MSNGVSLTTVINSQSVDLGSVLVGPRRIEVHFSNGEVLYFNDVSQMNEYAERDKEPIARRVCIRHLLDTDPTMATPAQFSPRKFTVETATFSAPVVPK